MVYFFKDEADGICCDKGKLLRNSCVSKRKEFPVELRRIVLNSRSKFKNNAFHTHIRHINQAFAFVSCVLSDDSQNGFIINHEVCFFDDYQ